MGGCFWIFDDMKKDLNKNNSDTHNSYKGISR